MVENYTKSNWKSIPGQCGFTENISGILQNTGIICARPVIRADKIWAGVLKSCERFLIFGYETQEKIEFAVSSNFNLAN